MANQSIGKVEIGDIYEDTESGRRVKIGRLFVDQGSNEFFQKPVGRRGRATRLSAEDVATMLSQGKIVCDQQSAKTDLINYIRVLTESRNSIHDAEIERIKNRQRTEEMDRNKRIHAKVKRKVHVARLFWLLACGTMVATVFIASIPAPTPAPAEKTIAGEGQNYGIDPDALSDSTYIEAMGSGSAMYGIVTDQNIVENGQESSGESAIKENAMFTPTVSKTQPLHMRPLTYDKQTFYQTAIKTNDINGGSTGVYLQNPNGNSLGVASNELVLAGGAGLGTIIISSPEKYEDKSASTTAKDIETQQQQAANDSKSSNSSSDMPGGKMQESWNGFDACDIDGNVIVGSYWYTKDASLEKKDLKRRIAVFNIKDVLAGSSDAVSDLEAVQLNYQDFDNDYYNPVVSESPASNGSTYWIGYTKQTEDGDTGFFIRCYENNNDLLMEDYENTFSTSDITGNSDPITNYTLFGDKLFYEQRGAIWVIDLSKLSANVDDYKRTIERENPVKIVDVIDMRASTTRDEQHIADLMGETVKPSCHYKVMTITTSKGVEYGIVFIDAQTGDLIYQPCYTMTTAASAVNNGGNIDSGTADEVTDLNESRIEKLREEKENKSKPSSSTSSNSNNEEDGNADAKNKNNGNSEDSGKAGDITMTGYHVDSAARVMLAANGSKTNLSYRQAADEETDSADSSDTGSGNDNATDGYATGGESDNSNESESKNENSNDELANGSKNENADDSASANADKAKAKNLNSSLGDDDTEEDRGTALTGRVIIRKGTKNNISILSYTIRGEQVVWLEEKQDDTKKREIRLSPIYYKDTSVQEADENADKDDKTKSSFDGDNENGENANASEILKSGVSENAEEAVKSNENENAGNENTSNTESDEEKAAAAAAAQAQAEEAKRKQEEADALRAEQERLANTPKTEFEDVE